MNHCAYAPGAHLRQTLIGCSLSEGPCARGHMRTTPPSLLQHSSFAPCTRARYPRAPTRVSPHSSFSGDQIYAYVGVVFVMAPLTPVKLQGYGPVRFPTSDRAEIWICYSARCVAPSLRFASRFYMWLRCYPRAPIGTL
jgi:hypothetical protein